MSAQQQNDHPDGLRSPLRLESSQARRGDRHRGAVLDAEVRRIVRQLRWCGPLTRRELERLCRTRQWREGSLEEALRRGIAAGVLRRLPFDYVAVSREEPAPRRRRPSG